MIVFSNEIVTLRQKPMDRKLIKSLLKESAYPEPAGNVRLIETHVSFIFLTDSFVYKVKKPVDYGFLNFTSLDRRRFYCEEEVRLNRRLCSDLYVGVVELRETPEGPKFGNGAKGAGSGGEVIDYAVKMKKLPEERMLSHLVERGEVTGAQIEEVARYVAKFHRNAEPADRNSPCGSLAIVRANWEENFRQAAPFQDQTIPRRDLGLIRGYVERFLAEHADLFRDRVAGGFIRDCDGDLHLENICLNQGVCIFDCIEFNDSFRFIDTASDIAFLLMDLEYAGRPDLGAQFLATYREATGDPGLGPLLDFYKCHRAFVRGKVKSIRMNEAGPKDQVAEAMESALRYFRLARGYALRSRLPPTLLITCGLMGSGKSALARELSFQLGAELVRSDQIRKALPQTPRAEGEAGYDQGIYSASVNRTVYQALLQRAREVLCRGGSIVVDATFRRRSDRDSFRSLAAELKVPFFILETRAPEQVIRERLERRRLDPTEISDGRWEIFPRHRSEFEAPAPGEAVILESNRSLADEVDQALAGMGLLP
jgi:uncharacterized protein